MYCWLLIRQISEMPDKSTQTTLVNFDSAGPPPPAVRAVRHQTRPGAPAPVHATPALPTSAPRVPARPLGPTHDGTPGHYRMYIGINQPARSGRAPRVHGQCATCTCPSPPAASDAEPGQSGGI